MARSLAGPVVEFRDRDGRTNLPAQELCAMRAYSRTRAPRAPLPARRGSYHARLEVGFSLFLTRLRLGTYPPFLACGSHMCVSRDLFCTLAAVDTVSRVARNSDLASFRWVFRIKGSRSSCLAAGTFCFVCYRQIEGSSGPAARTTSYSACQPHCQCQAIDRNVTGASL